MRLTRHTDYALRVLMYLGARNNELATITEVAEVYKISRNHLVKVVNVLGREGYLQTVRGKGGGIRLGMPPEQIGVGAVVRVMEENLDIIDCVGTECPIIAPCRLRTALGEARDAFLAVLDSYTLADLVVQQEQILHALFDQAPAT
ncbi:Rrf2 family transcriptional regulator [Thiohalorhabdus methylotrophus]|uniref:Rrf2 family transcriptional regulator n=1 Tax=Thiohalorhabdus methylotrophus TaxID=3242694 RepID=A0ABV4TYX5_9GAMM